MWMCLADSRGQRSRLSLKTRKSRSKTKNTTKLLLIPRSIIKNKTRQKGETIPNYGYVLKPCHLTDTSKMCQLLWQRNAAPERPEAGPDTEHGDKRAQATTEQWDNSPLR